MLQNRETPWLIRGRNRHTSDIRLFCFSYAGGGASVFRRWEEALPETVEVCAIQLPGRENRISETALTDLNEAVNLLAGELSPFLAPPFAFFGHSLGAKIAFELARKLVRENRPRPDRLFLSGCRAAHLPEPDPLYHLGDEAFRKALRRFDGTPEAVLENEDLMALFLPLLRADFTMDETYRFAGGAPLDIPITAFGGTRDKEASEEEIREWRKHTRGEFTVEMTAGGHFFIQEKRDEILKSVAKMLTGTARETRFSEAV